MNATTVRNDLKNEQVKQMWTWANNSVLSTGLRSFYLYISFVTVVRVTKLAQIATVYLLVRFSDPFPQSFFFFIYYFPSSSSPYTCRSDLMLLDLSHQSPPKALRW